MYQCCGKHPAWFLLQIKYLLFQWLQTSGPYTPCLEGPGETSVVTSQTSGQRFPGSDFHVALGSFPSYHCLQPFRLQRLYSLRFLGALASLRTSCLIRDRSLRPKYGQPFSNILAYLLASLLVITHNQLYSVKGWIKNLVNFWEYSV